MNASSFLAGVISTYFIGLRMEVRRSASCDDKPRGKSVVVTGGGMFVRVKAQRPDVSDARRIGLLSSGCCPVPKILGRNCRYTQLREQPYLLSSPDRSVTTGLAIG